MLVGHARIITKDQNRNFNLQNASLRESGCEKRITDTGSGNQSDREGLRETFEFLRKGDILAPWQSGNAMLSRQLPPETADQATT